MRSPIVAMLWENWRLTRVEAAVRLGLGLVAGSAALVWLEDGATVAFVILMIVYCMFWFSIAKLNGGRFFDGYKPGFPLYLLYTRPVPTVAIVGVAMAYDALSCTVLYLVSAALLGFAFGQPLPLFSMSVPLVTFHLICTAIQWSTRNRAFQWVGSLAVTTPFLLVRGLVASALHVEFSVASNVLMALIGLAAFGFTVAGVARQRHGGAVATVPRAAVSGEYPDWLVSRFRFPCPTSSATRAQVWFELKSSGLPVLAIGLTLSVVTFLLYAIGISSVPVRNAALGVPILFGFPLLLLLGGNAFGIRKSQGRMYVSAFEATQPSNTAQLAAVKLLVRTACLLAALIAFGLSLWASSSLVTAWGEWLADGKVDATPGLLQARQNVVDAFLGTGFAITAKAVIISVAVTQLVTLLATFGTFRMRYPRRLLVAGALLLLYCVALILLALAEDKGIAPDMLVGEVVKATGWIAVAAMLFATIYLLWRGFAERALTISYVCGAVVISLAFGLALLTVLQATGAQPAVSMLWLALLPPLMVGLMAPWSLSRIRHM